MDILTALIQVLLVFQQSTKFCTDVLKVICSLKLHSIVCVFDEAIYAKAVEIKWKSLENFRSCAFTLSIFHTLIMLYLGIVGKRFSGGGYRDLLVQSEVITGGSVDRTLRGKMYNRSVWAVKLTNDALSHMLLDKFKADMAGFNQIEEDIHVLSRDLQEEMLDEVIEKETVKSFNKNYIDFIDNIKGSGGD